MEGVKYTNYYSACSLFHVSFYWFCHCYQGGQILRMAIALSALLRKPVKITNIRAGRKKPGLAAQHLNGIAPMFRGESNWNYCSLFLLKFSKSNESIILGIELARELCGASAKGLNIGSTEVEFHPNQLKSGEYTADTKTAGYGEIHLNSHDQFHSITIAFSNFRSVSLLLQVSLPLILFAGGPTVLHLKGGTNAEMAPQIDFTTEIFRPNLGINQITS